jgi:short subunit fatty acids transporter
MAKKNKRNKEWEEYRKSLLLEKSKSDDDFEKYITLISSGGLGITIAYMNQIVPLKEAIVVWVLLLGWVLLTVTLFLNLYSHYKASKDKEDTIKDIDEDEDYDCLLKNIDKRNKVINRLNFSSIICLGLGLLSIILFTIINSYHG